MLRLDAVVLDPRAQPRTVIDSALVDEYAEAMRSGASFPPIVVFSDGDGYWLADGWHRHYAAKKAKVQKLDADIKQGTVRDAILYAMGANALHGARRTPADKRRAIMTLLRDAEWGKWNDNKIAKRCGVDGKTVASVRLGLASSEIPKIANTTRLVERAGIQYEMDTARIGPKVDAVRADPALQPHNDLPKFNRTNDNIGWAQWSWNPVTGCKLGCPYCYAHDIAMRFDGHFEPTFHESRLTAPVNTNPIMDHPGGQRVFVCSMADLFGAWVPNEWVLRVMESVRANPQWTFLFLTKNPRRYESVIFPDNAWIGATVDVQARVEATEKAMSRATAIRKFVSCEPLLERLTFKQPEIFDWFLIGAKSEGQRKVQPDPTWIISLIGQAYAAGKPVWMKDNLSLIQQEPT